MCVAIIVPADKQAPSEEVLLACEESNPAGGGIAWVENNAVHFKKNIDTKEILEIISKTKPPYLIHYRIPTVGGRIGELCHPFPINKRASTELSGRTSMALVHNGTWTTWRQGTFDLLPGRFPEGPWSDTRAMAYLAHHYGLEILQLIDEKTAVLLHTGTIRYFGTGWTEENGVYFSNTGWKYRHNKSTNQVITGHSWNGNKAYSSTSTVKVDKSREDTITIEKGDSHYSIVLAKNLGDSDLDKVVAWAGWQGIKVTKEFLKNAAAATPTASPAPPSETPAETAKEEKSTTDLMIIGSRMLQ